MDVQIAEAVEGAVDDRGDPGQFGAVRLGEDPRHLRFGPRRDLGDDERSVHPDLLGIGGIWSTCAWRSADSWVDVRWRTTLACAPSQRREPGVPSASGTCPA